MTRKRYNENRAAALLTRVVEFAASDNRPTQADDQTLRALGRARLGFVVSSRNDDEIALWVCDQTSAVLAMRDEWRDYLRTFTLPSDRRWVLPVKVVLGSVRRGNRVEVGISGAPRDVLSIQLVQLVAAAGADRLRVCTARGCGTVFVRRGRKEFCSETCQKRTYMRRWRAE